MSRAFKLAIVATAVGTVLALAPVSGQTPAAVDKDWRPARTADGQPDIQGFWANQGRRLATYNIEDVRTADLKNPAHPRLTAAAALIQHLRPDVLLINEMTYDQPGDPG